MPRKLKKPRMETSENYLFQIEKLRSHYSVSGGSKFQPTAYDEYLQPNLEAVCLFPSKLKDREVQFTLIGDRQIEQDLWMQKPAPKNENGVGTLTMRGAQSRYVGSMPYDALWRIQPLILAGGIRFIYLHGAAMFRGEARIGLIGFYDEFDLDDL